MPDDDEFTIGSSEPWVDAAGKKHNVKITFKKGKKPDGKKRRESDEVSIGLYSTKSDGHEGDWGHFIFKGETKGTKKILTNPTTWISTEENDVGGWTGIAEKFALRVHCPKLDEKGNQVDPKDKPTIEIGISDQAREAMKKAGAGATVPPLPGDGEGSVVIQITEPDQIKLNDYFQGKELPKQLS